jgi:Tol biopolymer transport system component
MMLAFLFFILLSCNGQLDAGQLESRRLANIRQVTSGFAKAGEGYFSPDGRRIVFQAVPKEYPFYQI